MSDPQNENGYLAIPHDIAEALMRTRLSPNQSRLLWAILRKTWGWHKESDWISNSQFVEMTGISRGHVSRGIRELVMRNIVTRAGNKTAFNKDYTQWRELPIGVRGYQVTNSGNTVTPSGNTVTPMGNKVTRAGEHKRYSSKQSLQKQSLQKGGAAFPPFSEEGESGAPLGIPPEKDWPPIDYIPEAPGPWEAQLPFPLPWREFVRYLGDTGKDVESGMLSALEGIEDIEDGYTAFVGSSFVIGQIEKYRKELEELAGQFFSKPVMITFKVKQEQKGDNRGRLYQGSSSTHC